MTRTTPPDCLVRLSQDHIDLRLALNLLEGEVNAVAQYHDPDGELLGGSAQYFANFPAGCHHPIEDMILAALTARAPRAAEQAKGHVAQHRAIEERVGELAMMVRNLFIDTPKWRLPFCATARAFIVMKRDHIRAEERTLFRLALEHLTQEEWRDLDRAARDLQAHWTNRTANAAAVLRLGFRTVREGRASAAARRA